HQDIRQSDALRDVVDDLGLGQHRADAGDELRVLGRERLRPHLLEGDLEVLRTSLDEATGSRGALLVHLELEHLSRRGNGHRPGGLRAHIDDQSGLREEEDGAARRGSEIADLQVPFGDRVATEAGRAEVVDVARGDVRRLPQLLQHVPSDLHRNPPRRGGGGREDPPTVFEQHALDDPSPEVEPAGDHDAPPATIRSRPWSAAPSAPRYWERGLTLTGAPSRRRSAWTIPSFWETPPVKVTSGSTPTRCISERVRFAMLACSPARMSFGSLPRDTYDVTSDSAKTVHVLVSFTARRA